MARGNESGGQDELQVDEIRAARLAQDHTEREPRRNQSHRVHARLGS